jgi:hypothetical protein
VLAAVVVEPGENDLVVTFVEDADAFVAGVETTAKEGQHEVVSSSATVVERADVVARVHLDPAVFQGG